MEVNGGFTEAWGSPRLKDFKGPWKSLQGRALDLKAAYKQLARHPKDSWASVLAVWNPTLSKVEFYESVALPFGSVCAVMAFNRVARALRLIMSELFMIVNTNFFDDFCQLEEDQLCSSSWETAEMVMKLLGWKICRMTSVFPLALSFKCWVLSLTFRGADKAWCRSETNPAGWQT